MIQKLKRGTVFKKDNRVLVVSSLDYKEHKVRYKCFAVDSPDELIYFCVREKLGDVEVLSR